MKKNLLLVIFPVLACCLVFGQIEEGIDRLKQKLNMNMPDSSRVLVLDALSYDFGNSNPDSCRFYHDKALTLARQIHFLRGESRVLGTMGRLQRILGDMPQALDFQFKALQIAENNHYLLEKTFCLNNLGAIYMDMQDYEKAKNYFNQVEEMLETNQVKDDILKFNIYLNKVWMYRKTNQLDSAMIALKMAEKMLPLMKMPDDLSYYYMLNGNLQFSLRNYAMALESLHKSISIIGENNSPRKAAWSYSSLAEFFRDLNQRDSAIFYSKKALAAAQEINFKSGILRAADLLATLYEPTDTKQALYYHKLAKSANEQMYGAQKVLALQKSISDEQGRQRKIEAERIAYQNKLKLYALLAGLGVMLLIGVILYNNNRQKHKANIVLGKTLADLKSTQSQLIQSEKMASLGELTAGIAHEIQNPLNFVNNFSEVNSELIKELKDEAIKGNMEEVSAIANDIESNSEKINHHGKRADAIVKGMLQHSQSSSGVKEPTDINKLTDEYLRLAYHGLLAKDKTFNATLKTGFDETIGNINIIPQDIGRVLLNLYNNAFYATNEKSKQHIEGYEPAVSVSTKKIGDKVFVSVKDNANGIPQKVIDKIFQPFFTTKPTGQGTGLGLSLAYDIVKAHSGEIKVKSKEGEGSEFVIQLPIKNNQ